MKLKDLKNGDIVATCGTSFLARQIHRFMRIYAMRIYKYDPGVVYNHTMTVISTTRGNILVAEAIGKGFVVRPIEQALNWGMFANTPAVIRPVEPFSSVELYRMRKQYLKFSHGNIEYEITNFIWWSLYILSNKKIDLSPKNNEKKLFCFETSALLWNAARPGFWVDPSKTTTVDMVNSRYTHVSILQY